MSKQLERGKTYRLLNAAPAGTFTSIPANTLVKFVQSNGNFIECVTVDFPYSRVVTEAYNLGSYECLPQNKIVIVNRYDCAGNFVNSTPAALTLHDLKLTVETQVAIAKDMLETHPFFTKADIHVENYTDKAVIQIVCGQHYLTFAVVEVHTI